MSRQHVKIDGLRHSHQLAANALLGLGRLGIQTRFVNFNKPEPLLIVAAENTNKLQGKLLGGGIGTKFGNQYLQMGGIYRGCHVQWRQYPPKKACDCSSNCVETLYCKICNRSNLIKG